MSALQGAAYDWVKAFHVIAVIAWMAGIFYLPRLFVYHVDAEPGSDKSETFKVMERRLYTAIMTPAMVAVWFFGIILATSAGLWSAHWLMVKLLFVIGMTVFHLWLGRRLREFANDENTRPARTYRIANELPTLLVIVIVIMVIVKPF